MKKIDKKRSHKHKDQANITQSNQENSISFFIKIIFIKLFVIFFFRTLTEF